MLPTNTVNITGLRTWRRGFSLRTESNSARRTMGGSKSERAFVVVIMGSEVRSRKVEVRASGCHGQARCHAQASAKARCNVKLLSRSTGHVRGSSIQRHAHARGNLVRELSFMARA